MVAYLAGEICQNQDLPDLKIIRIGGPYSAIESKLAVLAVLEPWHMATAEGEFYRDKQDERDGQDKVALIWSINFGPLAGCGL